MGIIKHLIETVMIIAMLLVMLIKSSFILLICISLEAIGKELSKLQCNCLNWIGFFLCLWGVP